MVFSSFCKIIWNLANKIHLRNIFNLLNHTLWKKKGRRTWKCLKHYMLGERKKEQKPKQPTLCEQHFINLHKEHEKIQIGILWIWIHEKTYIFPLGAQGRKWSELVPDGPASPVLLEADFQLREREGGEPPGAILKLLLCE